MDTYVVHYFERLFHTPLCIVGVLGDLEPSEGEVVAAIGVMPVTQEGGYEALTVRAVAEHAGVAVGSL